jgi:hypothetical protein
MGGFLVNLIFVSLALIPRPLLPKREKGSQVKVPLPPGEGFRVRGYKIRDVSFYLGPLPV